MNSKRLAHNFLQERTGGNYVPNDFEVLSQVLEYAKGKELKKFKVALLFTCLNEAYWEYAKDAINGAKKYFLPGHDVDFLVWTDMPKADEFSPEKTKEVILGNRLAQLGLPSVPEDQYNAISKEVDGSIQLAKESIDEVYKHTVFKTEKTPWPYPTLMRYHLYLQQEEKLKEYDYIFHCDIDMRFVNIIGDEILGEGLTVAQHPMYALREIYWYPYEPNKESAAYIKRPGIIQVRDGKKMFMPVYAAGGFQGGKTGVFLDAMKAMKKNIDYDFNRNYISRWNDESHWNRFLYDYLNDEKPATVLSPSYIYPDSLIKEYYEKIWGCSYPPKIVTLTKRFSISKEAGAESAKKMQNL